MFSRFKKIISRIISVLKKYPWKQSFYSLKFLPKVFSLTEKIVILTCFGAIIFLAVFIGYRDWLSNTKLTPDYGGEFKEGIVGESKDLDKHLARLTYAGLTKYDSNKNIIGDLAENWEIKDDGKTYVFHLRPNFNSQDLAQQIVSKNIWQDINISTPDQATVTFSFKQPFSPFLYTSTEPIFEYGPYRISKEGKDQVELSAREDYYAGRPYINKILVKIYPNEQELLEAAKHKDIQGLCLTKDESLDDFEKYEVYLPRDLILFFNLSNKDLQDSNVRRALKENTSPGKELNLRLVTSDNSTNTTLAKGIAEKWAKNGVNITLDIKDNITLQKTTIPKRDYDLLLYGLDYGDDPDPYPFWHSSQIKEDGKNLSSFKNTKADKLLESARQEFDFKKREEKYAEFNQILNNEIPMFVVEHKNYYYYISKDLGGIENIVGNNEADRFLNVANWFLETKRVKK